MVSPAPHSVNMIATGWQQEDGLVYIRLPQGKYQLGDNVFSVPYAGGEQIIDNDQLENLYRIFEENRVAHYVNADTKETMKIEDFIRRKQELDTKHWDSDNEMDVWPSITERHAYELFCALWQAVREPITTKQKVQILVEGQEPKNNHPHIKPIRKISGDLTNTLYVYSKNAHVMSLVEFFLKKNGYRQLEQEPPSLSNPKDMDKTYWFRDGTIEFAKIFPSKEAGSKYLTIEVPGLKKYEKLHGRMTGKFEELEAHFKIVDEDIRAILGAYFNKSRALDDIDTVTVGHVLSDLQSLSNLIYQIDSMKKTYSSYRQACSKIDEIIKTFRKAASE